MVALDTRRTVSGSTVLRSGSQRHSEVQTPETQHYGADDSLWLCLVSSGCRAGFPNNATEWLVWCVRSGPQKARTQLLRWAPPSDQIGL
jgi:hypothetical protein